MTSIRAEIQRSTPEHSYVAVWAGPDAEHRAHCGILAMRPEEAAELIGRIEAGEAAEGRPDAARSQEEIAARVREVEADDFYGWRSEVLLPALDFEHAREFLKPEATAEHWEEARHGNDLLEAARAYYGLALGKIRDHRGLSAERSTVKLAEFAWLLGRDDVITAMDAAAYPQYGAPKVRAFAAGLGLPWPDEPEMQRMAAGEPCEPGCAMGCGR